MVYQYFICPRKQVEMVRMAKGPKFQPITFRETKKKCSLNALYLSNQPQNEAVNVLDSIAFSMGVSCLLLLRHIIN